MKINYNNCIKQLSLSILSHNTNNKIILAYELIRHRTRDAYNIDPLAYITIENEQEYEFMLLALNLCQYFKHDKNFMYILQDAIISYEINNLFYISIPNEEAHGKISFVIKELEKIANRHNMNDDLRTSSIYRMLTYAQWEYENREDGEE